MKHYTLEDGTQVWEDEAAEWKALDSPAMQELVREAKAAGKLVIVGFPEATNEVSEKPGHAYISQILEKLEEHCHGVGFTSEERQAFMRALICRLG